MSDLLENRLFLPFATERTELQLLEPRVLNGRAVLAYGPNRVVYRFLKRVLDISGAALLLILLAPALLLIAVLVKWDSSGPAIYRQERVGCRRRRKGGVTAWEIRTFTFYKFRSMFSRADESVHQRYVMEFCRGQITESRALEAKFKLKHDSRVTRLGQILRRTSLDELPQLFNVLKGDMSLVGPRPVPPYEVAHYSQDHFGRFAALPGITGPWQVWGRGRVPFERMMQMDIEYTQQCSLWLDAKVLLLTLPAVIFGRGAH
jgi:lipopolysaccharide/colanic/teichoic acid biosynthesis glycosyltransferase